MCRWRQPSQPGGGARVLHGRPPAALRRIPADAPPSLLPVVSDGGPGARSVAPAERPAPRVAWPRVAVGGRRYPGTPGRSRTPAASSERNNPPPAAACCRRRPQPHVPVLCTTHPPAGHHPRAGRQGRQVQPAALGAQCLRRRGGGAHRAVAGCQQRRRGERPARGPQDLPPARWPRRLQGG